MLTLADLPLQSIVSFDYYADHVLGTGVRRAKVIAFLDAETASLYADVAAIWANVAPSLPGTVGGQFSDYPFVKLRLSNGQTSVASLAWIRDESLTVETTRKMRLEFNSVTPEDQNAILEALSANGFTANSSAGSRTFTVSFPTN